MNWKDEWKWLAGFIGVFFAFYFLPVGLPRFDGAITEGLELAKWYTREHVVLCLVPALFIAGGISAFVSQASVMKYFGAKANKFLSYGVASVSGTILAVCSCTVLPLFAGIYKRGAGLGPAIAFLYSGPAINVLAIVLTARILGFEMGAARAIGAVVFSVVIGLAMHFIFRHEEDAKVKAQADFPEPEVKRPLWQTSLYFAAMAAVLIFANWAKADPSDAFFYALFQAKWLLTAASAVALGLMLKLWFGADSKKLIIAALPAVILAFLYRDLPVLSFSAGFIGLSWLLNSSGEGEMSDWFAASWDLSKQIFPLLIGGVFVSGFLLGRPGHEGVIPSTWVAWAVGGNSFAANFFSSIVAAFMYFATLTEVPILQGLIGSGMGKGPALALLLAGPALSLPSMLVLKSVMGTKKTAVYVTLVVIMATFSGMFYGTFF
ncbi:MAG: permease [Elusimicrobia bacterium RIFOXYA12_FULL_51_18]|nr:MAG: permease [Elusimicrobia bacterium RIFOXYA12_FULL_51_18]OGS29013.1 MAG: permease [Elusimicrobia bacterium RIFOXYA2_FULL_53_38]